MTTSTFYKPPHSIDFYKDIIEHSYNVFVHELVSFTREKSDKDVNFIFNNWDKVNHKVFIIRPPDINSDTFYIEAGVCLDVDDITYFLFCFLDKEKLNYFVDKYKLKLL